MMSALYSAVSGLKSQQTGLDVISNNISNVNTTGYKAQTVSFGDLLSQTLNSASSSTSTTGGTNPVQIGMGVSVASITANMTVGSTESTGVSTDVAITGAGFLVVQGGTSGEYQYTRAGDLSIDASGNITVDGYKVCGWTELNSDGTYNTNGTVSALNIYSDSSNSNKKIMAPAATTEADFSGNLTSSATVVSGAGLANVGSTPTTYDQTSSMTLYDSQGNSYSAVVSWKKCAVDSTSNVTSWYYSISSSDASISPSSGYVQFDSNGKIVTDAASTTSLASAIDTTATNTTGYTNSNISISSGLATGAYTITVAASSTSGYDITLTDSSGTTVGTAVSGSSTGAVTFTAASGETVTLSAPSTLAAGSTTFNVTSNTSSFSSTPTVTITPTTGGRSSFDMELNFASLSTYNSSSSSTVSVTADGYKSGELQSESIGTDGVITGTYSNGKTQTLGQIALAVFNNANGLNKIGDSLYASTSNSGDPQIVVAGTGGSGALSAGMLEMSNVDLSDQLTAMMISQRAYQANSKVINSADEMIQAVLSMVG